MTGIDRRGEVVAGLGAALSLAGAALLVVLAVWSRSSSVWAAAFQMLGAVGIWVLALIQLHQQRLVHEERLEVAELERLRREKLGGAQTIFDEEDLDQMGKLAMARRLRSVERFLIPTIALIVAAYHLVAGVAVFPWIKQFPPIEQALAGPIENTRVLPIFTGAVAFACFMLSRYALGMSRLKDWWPLRAGGDFTFGSSAVCLSISIAMLCVISGLAWVEPWLGKAIGLLLILLAGETVVNFILDFYRPRVPGQLQRPFYDSRLLGIFSEPGGILRSLANAIDYQFGFKVSETWFYKLLGRAVMPLILMQAVVILALTCIVVVPPGHKAVVKHYPIIEYLPIFGRVDQPSVYTAKPGILLTWFWPIDQAEIIPVERVQRLEIGFETEAAKTGEGPSGPVLWTKKHYKKEYQLLVADKTAGTGAKMPVNLLSLNMPVQWRVKDSDDQVIRFYSQSQEVAEIIESLAYRELTCFAAQSDVLALMGEGGIRAAAKLHERIQEACDAAGFDGKGLGVQIVYVGIGGIHPPPDQDVAKSYEDVVSAWEKRSAAVKAAEGDAARMQVASAGLNWQQLYDAIMLEDQAREAGEIDMPERTRVVERMLRGDVVEGGQVGGYARQLAADAVQRTWDRVFGEMSSAERYRQQLIAYQAAPRVYQLRLYLRMLETGMRNVRKYVIALDDASRVLYELDLKPPAEFDVIGAELGASEARQQ